MLRRFERPVTDAEWAELSVVSSTTWNSTWWERVNANSWFILTVWWLVVTAFSLGLAGACYLGSTGMTGLARLVTLACMGLLILSAFFSLWKLALVWCPPKITASRKALADRSERWSVVEVNVEAAWWIQTGDDDVPTLLVRTAPGQYVSMYTQLLDDLWDIDDPATTQRVRSTIRFETISVAEHIKSSGKWVAVRTCELQEPWPRRGTPWWATHMCELSESQLGPVWINALNASPVPSRSV
jgi:hypothetical protein